MVGGAKKSSTSFLFYNLIFKISVCFQTKSCKPELCVAEKCDFYGDTEYKTSYNYKQAAACPVLSLAELGYEFVQQTKDGHQVFSKFCDPACPHNFQKPNLGTAPPKK